MAAWDLSRFPQSIQDAINALPPSAQRDAIRLIQKVQSGQKITDARGQLMALGMDSATAAQAADLLQQQQGMGTTDPMVAYQASGQQLQQDAVAQSQDPNIDQNNNPLGQPTVALPFFGFGIHGTDQPSTGAQPGTLPPSYQARQQILQSGGEETPTSNAGYSAYLNNYRMAAKRAGEDPNGAMGFSDWMHTQSAGTEGVTNQVVMQAMEEMYRNVNLTSMPADVKAKVQAALDSADLPTLQGMYEQAQAASGDPTALSQMGVDLATATPAQVAAAMSKARSALGSYAGLTDILKSAQENSAQTKKQQFSGTYQRLFNTTPSQDVIDAHYNDSPAQLQSFFDNTIMPGTNLTLYAYNTAESNAKNLWAKYWPDKTPTLADVQWVASFKSQQELQMAVNKLPSYVPGMDIGTQEAVGKATAFLRPKLWNMPSDLDFNTMVANSLKGTPGFQQPDPGAAPVPTPQPPQDPQWHRIGPAIAPPDTPIQRIGPAYG